MWDDKGELICALCRRSVEWPVMDHCHHCGMCRGWVCRSCNGRLVRQVADLFYSTAGDGFRRVEMCQDNPAQWYRSGWANLAHGYLNENHPRCPDSGGVQYRDFQAARRRLAIWPLWGPGEPAEEILLQAGLY